MMTMRELAVTTDSFANPSEAAQVRQLLKNVDGDLLA